MGIIGAGGIAATHVPGWQASEHAEMVAGSDIREDVLKTWGEGNGICRLHRDPADLRRDPEIDVVDICTPNRYHAPLAITALEAGKHVLCEKPLAPTPMPRSVWNSPVPSRRALPHRYRPSNRCR